SAAAPALRPIIAPQPGSGGIFGLQLRLTLRLAYAICSSSQQTSTDKRKHQPRDDHQEHGTSAAAQPCRNRHPERKYSDGAERQRKQGNGNESDFGGALHGRIMPCLVSQGDIRKV